MKVARAGILATVLAGFAIVVWFAGPSLTIGEGQPLASVWIRGILIASVAVAAFVTLHFVPLKGGRTGSIDIAPQVPVDDPEGIATRLMECLESARRMDGIGRGFRTLPTFLVIGPKSAGKTTVLARSGLKPAPTCTSEIPSAQAAPTRDCDVWQGGGAAYLDTAGRLTMHESPLDRQSWLALLSALQTMRTSHPIAGVLVMVELETMSARTDAVLAEQTTAIRKRLDEISVQLANGIPVHLLFTKADRLVGFTAFMGRLDESRRRQEWGFALDASARGETLVGDVMAGYDTLLEHLCRETKDRLHEAPDLAARIAIFGFPRHFARLKEGVADFVDRICSRSETGPQPSLQSVSFTSVTRQAATKAVSDTPADSDASVAPDRAHFAHDLLKRALPAAAKRDRRFGGKHATALRHAATATVVTASIAALAVLGVSFAANRSLIAATDNLIEQDRAGLSETLGKTTVTDVDLENIVDSLILLRDLPVGYASHDLPPPVLEGAFGLGQRPQLQEAAELAYRRALERQLRPRLILQVERAVRDAMTDPDSLYEPLKVYLQLGGQAPRIDNEVTIAWVRRDWEGKLYPGPINRAGREELEAHLRAMLALDIESKPVIALDRPLVEAAQRLLSRMQLVDLAWAQVTSASHASQLEDFSVPTLVGRTRSFQVFETRDGRDDATLRIPGFYTYSGFHHVLLPQLATVGQRIVDDQWLLGSGGERVRMEQQLKRLGPELLDRYSRDFLAAWNGLLDNLKLRPLTEDGPDYRVLHATGLPDSPLGLLVESIARETRLTRPLQPDEAAAGIALPEMDFMEGLARVGIALPGNKSQSRAGGPLSTATGQIPGANIEAHFRPYHMLVDDTAGRRPIDVLVQTFGDIHQSLLLAARSPTQAERAQANLQLQVHNLRINASRLPRQLARIVHSAADDLESDAVRTSLEDLDDLLKSTITDPCKALVADAYPFMRNSQLDASVKEFARLFSPGGELDRFFVHNLAPFADITGSQWQWKADERLGRDLPGTTLLMFQRAAQIRDAFFQEGRTTPAIEVTITPFSLHRDIDTAVLEVNGRTVQSYQTGNVPVKITWPGPETTGAVNLSLMPEIPGRPDSVRFEGPWALMRLLDTGSITSNADDMQVQIVIGGRDVNYTIRVESAYNPFTLPALGEFRCPDEL